VSTLYSVLGPHLIDALVDRLYERIMVDEELAPFFQHMDVLRQRTRMKTFLTIVTGGSTRPPADMRVAHQRPASQGMTDPHFDRVVAHLVVELRDFGVPEERIAELGALVETLRPAVLNR
jgi:hemoglobin